MITLVVPNKINYIYKINMQETIEEKVLFQKGRQNQEFTQKQISGMKMVFNNSVRSTAPKLISLDVCYTYIN